MEVNVQKIEELIKEKFNNNKSKFAKTIGISREYITNLINGKKEGDSAKICNAIILFCESNNLDYKEYIFLP
ncbi:MAG: hypothetical protein HFJ27_01690 [Clostridia bacterium]|nr:hypothetical protein [Clostridia bacterium]